jgi:peptidyl-Lys metalloendopeptidase
MFSRGLAAALVLGTFAACASDEAAGPPPPSARDAELKAAVALDRDVFVGDERPMATVTITNAGARPAQLLSYYVSDDELAAPLLAVWLDGAPVAYTGPLVKRRAPEADDFVTLAPGAAITRRIDLGLSYDLSRSGDYTIRVQVPSADLRGELATDARQVVSTSRAFWAEGRVGRVDSSKRPPPDTSGGFTFNRCSAEQQTQLIGAVDIARSMSQAARTYLAGSPSATPRYVTWFGAFSNAGWSSASTHFTAIAGALATQPLDFDCKCKQKNVYAYVNPGEPYSIHLCGAFWAAPPSGTDSRGGTLVHEMSHFDVTAGTDDWAYGQSACRSLAASDPTRALDNADSHEYFAENTPAQP